MNREEALEGLLQSIYNTEYLIRKNSTSPRKEVELEYCEELKKYLEKNLK
jgi:hypothetical protein